MAPDAKAILLDSAGPSMSHHWDTIRALIAFTLAQAWYYRRRALAAIFGVALAVALFTLLLGLGHGVSSRGLNALEATNRELWLSAPIQVTPAVGGVANGITDAHLTVQDLESHPGVRGAQALSFQTTYVSPNGSEFTTVVGVGITGTSSPLTGLRGPGFEAGDVHYANGSYDGPLTREIIVDERTAARLGVGLNDSIFIGGTIATARDQQFRVVGIAPTFSALIGTPTVTLHLSELQELTGTTGADSATIIAISTADGTDPRTVRADLDTQYPDYTVRTNRQQFSAVLGRQGAVITSVVAIVAAGTIGGAVILAAMLGKLVYLQRRELAALQALGVSRRTLRGIVLLQALLVTAVGSLIGLALVRPLANVLNRVVAVGTGYGSIVALPAWIYGLGLGLAFLVGAAATGLGSWQLRRLGPDLLGRPPI